MKKLYLLLTLLLFIPFGVKALEPNYNINGLYINADIKDNGDMLVKEQIVMNGSFNGYVRDLYYKGNYSLYDASDLELVRVCEIPSKAAGSFDMSLATLDCFVEDDYAMPGDSSVYTRSEYIDYTSLKMFNYTPNGTKVFYIEYLLKDVVVIHNDVAELYWTFIGENFSDDIANVNITINLPSKSSDLRVWAHGPLTGNISRENNNKIVAAITDLYANNLVDVRTTFDKSIIPYGTKVSNDDALSSIVKEEQKRADDANKKREAARVISYGMLILNGLWIVGAVYIAMYAYKKYDKERKSTFDLEYHREFPAEYGPEVVEYLMKKSVTPLALSATILNIIRKKGLEVREVDAGKNKNYILITNDVNDTLTADELYVKQWLINDVGNGVQVSLKDIKDASNSLSSAKDFMEKYNKWNAIAKMNGTKEDFYESCVGFKIKAILYGFLGVAMFVIAMSLTIESPLLFLTPLTALIFIVYIASFTKRSVKGNDHYVKWNAFKKFLLDFGRFNEKELPEIVLWEKYLVYATVFGIADKVSKTMEIKIRDMGTDTVGMPLYTNMYFNYYFANSLVNTVNTVRTASMSKIAQSRSSSGSGFGGGFSGGGGFGGGGVGGGGHGF